MTDPKIYVEIAVARPVFKTLTYAVPPALEADAVTGKRVLVPVRGQKVTGYILNALDKTEQEDVKEILEVLDVEPLFPPSMTAFFRWIADYYLYPIGEVIQGALPSGINARQVYLIAITSKGRSLLTDRTGAGTPIQELLNTLEKTGPVTEQVLSRKWGSEIPSKVLSQMEKEGLICREWKVQAGRVRPKKEPYVKIAQEQTVDGKLSETKRKVLDLLKNSEGISLKRIKEDVGAAGPVVRKMARDGFLEIFEREVYRDPFGDPIERDPTAPVLSEDQAPVVSQVIASLGKGFKTFLLHGVTGSGKTEVYMQAAAEVLRRNGQVLVLVPEISLISQTERRFRARFGDCVALLHSGLSHGERLDQWMRILRNEARIAIGARSAIFAPFSRLGLIVVDEEHDDSYKQESRLRYHARDLAIVRAKSDQAVALLGSATPSLQSYYNVQTKRYHGLCLEKRIENQPLAEVTVVDLRETDGFKRTKPLVTPELKKAMEETLQRGEQTLLFLNRRGFASYPTCTCCGTAIRCKNCDVTMTFHKGANAFRCHYCGFSLPTTTGCSVCGNAKVKHLGLGTEKLEAKVKEMFPDARVARMDRDTTTARGSLLTILKDLRRGDIDILVGTQMIVKGHHYPNITLVGILCADLSLNFPDFRAGERTFQLLAQVAGRAGRGKSPGRVILQTFNPEHFCVKTAAQQAYLPFYEHEMAFRKSLLYPPYARLVQLLITGKDKEKTARCAAAVGALCREVQRQAKAFQEDVRILGPVPAPVARIQQKYRWLILLKGRKAGSLHNMTRVVWAQADTQARATGATVTVNVDPVDML